jgi:ADP-ribosylglycohydrolase
MENLKKGVPALEAGPRGGRDNGNGSLMRILPLSIFLHDADESLMAAYIWKASRITHGHPRACSACFIYSILVKELLHGSAVKL